MNTINEFSLKGIISDEFGDKVGSFWYRSGMKAYTIQWHGIRLNGYTLEGIFQWAERLGYQVL